MTKKLTSQSPDAMVISQQPDPELDLSNVKSSLSDRKPGILNKSIFVF